MSDAHRHSLVEDIQGLAFGVCMGAVGMHILTTMGFIAGQTPGLAVLIAHITGLPFPLVYFAISAPFLLFGWRRMGLRFTVKTLICIAALSILAALLPWWITFSHIAPGFAAVLFGALFGIAALAVVRHGGSFGGVSILWLMVQDRTGFPAGYAQLIFDAALFAFSALFIAPAALAWSFLGALVFNLFLAINHRKDRYVVAT